MHKKEHKTLKANIITAISWVFQKADLLFVFIGVTKPKVIIYMDGGICSQMHMYVHGQYYHNKGFNVYYDIDWFIKCGKDMDGIFDRKLELLDAFPTLQFNTIHGRISKFYRKYFKYILNGGELPHHNFIRRTTYFYGYFYLNSSDYDTIFNQCYKLENRHSLKRIESDNNVINCAVHVRRGDLANREFEYYRKPQNEYFIDSINNINNKYNNVHFYIFSDELDWVENNICPKIKAKYQLVRGNKAYEDLLLISQCNIVIASQGSFGRFGAKLNGNSILITPDSFYENLSCSNNL